MTSNPMTKSQEPFDALAGKLKRTELQHSASSILSHRAGAREEIDDLPAAGR